MRVTKRRFYRTTRGKTIILSVILSACLIFVGLAVAANMWYQNQLNPVSSESSSVTFLIPEGQLASATAQQLEAKSIIKSSQAFMWYLKNKNLTDKIKAGTYELDPSNSTPEIIDIIASGEVKTKNITILPGKRIDQIRQIFIDNGFSAAEVDVALDPSNYRNHPALIAKPTDQTLEGYIFPETFRIDSSTSAQQIIKLALDEMTKVLTPSLINDFQKQNLGIHQAVTLASLIEKEAANDKEKKDIAGVFINRLRLGMKLQSDPTYKYAAYQLNVPPNPSINSPYNTYLVTGLPPGPISNVSKASLEAVANPAAHDYLYFVAGDDDVTRFAKTIEEHEALARQYCQKKCSTY